MTRDAPPSVNTLLASCKSCGAKWLEKWRLQGFEKVWKPPKGLFDHMDRGLKG